MSLRKDLNEAIKQAGWLSIDEIETIAKLNGKKISNAERRLRPSDSPMVEATRNEKGYITGYKWKQPTWDSLKAQVEKSRQEAFKLQ